MSMHPLNFHSGNWLNFFAFLCLLQRWWEWEVATAGSSENRIQIKGIWKVSQARFAPRTHSLEQVFTAGWVQLFHLSTTLFFSLHYLRIGGKDQWWLTCIYALLLPSSYAVLRYYDFLEADWELSDKTGFLPGNNNAPRQICFTEVSGSAKFHWYTFLRLRKVFLVVTKERYRIVPKPSGWCAYFKAKKSSSKATCIS